jgi:DNA transposase THAP9
LRTLVKRDLDNSGPYDPLLKAFAMNINFYSNAAYSGLRTTLHNILPHNSTIKRWYSVIDGSPGFTLASLDAIKCKVQGNPPGTQTLVALSMDEVAIRKHVEWDDSTQKMAGYVCFTSDVAQVADKALMFMATSINDDWKIPLGYFTVSGLDGEKRSVLLTECLKFINEGCPEAIICTLTFDGDPANLKMVEEMGAKFVDDDLCACFIDPSSKRVIHIILDMCHMLKLIRNNLSKREVFYYQHEKIEWRLK